MADPYASLGVEDDEDYRALGLEDEDPIEAQPVPDETSVSAEPYGPEPRRTDLDPSAMRNIRDAAEVMGLEGLIPSERAARGGVATALQGIPFVGTWTDELAGKQAELQQILENTQRPPGEQIDPRWKYRNVRDRTRHAGDDFFAKNPAAAFALTVGTGAALNPLQVTGGGLLKYAPTGAEGAISGAGAVDEAENMGMGAALGAPLAMAGQKVGETIGEGVGEVASWMGRGVKRLAEGIVKPSPAAQYLEGQGVKDLTIGQMTPGSTLAQIEEASQSVGGVGSGIAAQRQVGREGWQQTVLNRARPPISEPLDPTTGVAERLGQAYEGFGDAYAAARGARIIPEGIARLADAADNPHVLATDETRHSVGNFLRNQLTLLRGDEAGGVASDQILAMRSAIREAIRDSDDPATRRLLQTAVDDLTNLLDAQLPPQAANALRAADRQYAQYKVVEDAVRRAGDQPGGFTPAQLSAAVKGGTEAGRYARGGGGTLRDLAETGREALDTRSPPTGGRLLTSQGAQWVTAPAAYLANLPGPKNALLGRTAAQRNLAASPALAAVVNATPAMTAAGGSAGQSSARAYMADNASEGDFLESLTRENPEALGPYATTLQQAAAEGNLPLVHWRLQQTDPQYRLMLEEARKAHQ